MIIAIPMIEKAITRVERLDSFAVSEKASVKVVLTSLNPLKDSLKVMMIMNLQVMVQATREVIGVENA